MYSGSPNYINPPPSYDESENLKFAQANKYKSHNHSEYMSYNTSNDGAAIVNVNANSQGLSLNNNNNFVSRSEQKTYHDTFWAALFLCHLFILIVTGILCWYYIYCNWSKSVSNKNVNDPVSEFFLNFSWSGPLPKLFIILFTVAIILSYLFIKTLQSHGSFLVWFCLLFNVASTFILSILLILTGALVPSFILFGVGFVQLLYVFLVRDRIKFAAAMLEIVSGVIQVYSGVVLVCVLGVLAQALWIGVWVFCGASILTYLSLNNEGVSFSVNLVYFLLLISFFWTATILSNIIHLTVAGVIANWFFSPPTYSPNGTMNALRRSLTWSFGSICLGSLLVAVLKAIRVVVNQATKTENECLRAIVLCLIDLIDSAIQFFNVYAYSYIAIYGDAYCEAASHAWDLVKTRGIEALINDDLSGSVLMFGAAISACLVAALGGGLAKFLFHLDSWPVYVILGGTIGFVMMLCALEIISAGISCLFVCFADDSVSLQVTKPEVFDKLMAAYTNAPSYEEATHHNQETHSLNNPHTTYY